MFHWDDGLVLTKAGLAVDFRRRQPRAFISHAHSDHIGRHEYALCTAETAALYRHRLGDRRTLDLPYRTPFEWGGLRLTTLPAGHCLGSAMLLAEDGEQSLLYTGDFKLGESATAERAELPHAEILVIESTYGTPAYRLPPRQQAIEQLCECVRAALAAEQIPVVEAYALGKAQEVTRILALAGFQVLQDAPVHAISAIYESFGVAVGCCGPLNGKMVPGHVAITTPRARRCERTEREVRIAVTGWAIDPRTKYRLGVDHAIPLSDHADYDDLIEAVRRVAPQRVYCTHGPESFVDRLCEEGFDARVLGRLSQGRLF
jgi:Cft2 family RNA processing exonuclease